MGAPRPGRLKYRIALPMTCVVVALLAVSIVLGYRLQSAQAEQALREQAHILSQQMSAVWDFVSVNQDKINHDADGTYNFKGLHCSVAGTAVGALFTDRTNYEIAYVSDVPRNPRNAADGFELTAIEAFRADPGLGEYAGFEDRPDGAGYYRYVVPLKMSSQCESCHGLPAGEVDATGFEKEGLSRGDLVGAASISIPTHLHDEGIFHRTALQSLLSALVLAACLLTVYAVVTMYVTRPIEAVQDAIRDAGRGGFGGRIDPDRVNAKDEMRSLIEYYNEMAAQLERLYGGLEGQVRERTAQLARANEELSRQARRLEEANAKLEADDRYKSHYFTMMSHELRTPLTAIGAYVGMLRDLPPDSGRFADILGKVQANAASLTRLVNNILASAKLEAGEERLDLRVVDVVDVMGALGRTLEPLAEERGILLYLYIADRVPLVMADEAKLLHILENLGSNAIKYAAEGGVVIIEAYHHRKDATLRFSVIDDGAGVPEADQEAIFRKFVQSEASMSRPVSGSGLGLALAREYAELHGGRIELRSKAGDGSVFRLVLPCGNPPDSEGGAYGAEGADS